MAKDDRKEIIPGFRQLAPGVFVSDNSGVNIKFPHPDPGWIIIDEETGKKIVGSSDQTRIYIFSSEDRACKYVKDGEIEGAVVKGMTWNELAEKYGIIGRYGFAIIDPEPEAGFYQVVPLKMDN